MTTQKKRSVKRARVPLTSFAEDLQRDVENETFKAVYEAEKLRLTVALLLSSMRKKHRVSQKAMASALGTSQSAIARIESGRENFTIDTLGRMAAALRKNVKISLV